eukprot:Ihof_evm6s20 gene=Ihof_evmTU6s20
MTGLSTPRKAKEDILVATPTAKINVSIEVTPEETVNCMKRLFESPPTPKDSLSEAWGLATPPPYDRHAHHAQGRNPGQLTPGVTTPAKKKPKTSLSRLKMQSGGINTTESHSSYRPRTNPTKSVWIGCGGETGGSTGYESRAGPNVNPFTPVPSVPTVRKSPASTEGRREHTLKRYEQEFEELELLGSGEYGNVYKCINRLDGCFYAIKRTKKPFRGSTEEQEMLREVYAHAVLGVSPYVVRYYSAWEEDNHMLIQNEYCPHGSLTDLMGTRTQPFSQHDLADILYQVAEGIRVLHSHHMVHMDVKPGNVFVASAGDEPRSEPLCSIPEDHLCNPASPGAMKRALTRAPPPVIHSWPATESSIDGPKALSTAKRSPIAHRFRYKIGDLGHATTIKAPQITQEGDCRYLALEVLQETYTDLRKADIFSLGISIWELGQGRPPPPNGEEWRALREDKIPDLPQCDSGFNALVKDMMCMTSEHRPTCEEVVARAEDLLSRDLPTYKKSKNQLARELDTAKKQSKKLLKELAIARTIITQAPTPARPDNKQPPNPDHE